MSNAAIAALVATLCACHCDHDGGGGGSGTGSDAGSAARPDAAVDAGVDAAVDAGARPRCPRWTQPMPPGHRWLYAQVKSSAGVALTPRVNHVDVYVQEPSAKPPGEHADPDEPCTVASYEESAAKVRVLAAAIGFSSIQRDVSPASCGEAEPCELVLPPSLDAQYYVTTAHEIRVRSATEVTEAKRPELAAAVAGDALERAKVLHRDLGDELERSAAATQVPAPELAVRYTEAKLQRRCDASCIGDKRLDPALRAYLRKLRRPPFR